MALGDGTHKLPVSAAIRKAIGKAEGDTVRVHLVERLSGDVPRIPDAYEIASFISPPRFDP